MYDCALEKTHRKGQVMMVYKLGIHFKYEGLTKKKKKKTTSYGLKKEAV